MPMTSPVRMALPAASLASLTAWVTSPVFTSENASVMLATFSSSPAPSQTPNSAANACGTLFVGTTAHRARRPARTRSAPP